MTWHTEKYCDNLENVDRAKMIRAIHEAHMQLCAVNRELPADCNLDQFPALASLADCLREAGHVGFIS